MQSGRKAVYFQPGLPPSLAISSLSRNIIFHRSKVLHLSRDDLKLLVWVDLLESMRSYMSLPWGFFWRGVIIKSFE